MHSTTHIRIFALAAAAAVAGGRAIAEDYAAWGKSAAIYLRTAPDGANVAGTVRRFPVLVRLASKDFPFSEARGEGQDIRFSAAGGNHLQYQIDRWDSAQGVAEVWVLADSVAGNSSGQALTLHWGNPSAADSSNGGAVFDSANGFFGAWHLGGSGTAARKNAVKGGWDAEPQYFDGGESRAGIIGLADSLDGDAPYGDHFQIGDGYAELSGGFTFSIWCKPAAASANARLFDLGNGPGLDELLLQRSGASQGIVYENYQSNVKGRSIKVDNCFPVGQWQQFTVTVSGNKLALYRNGALIAADTNAGNAVTPVRRAFNYMGRNDWAYGSYFQGLLDEPRLSRTARSADWIRLAYANQGPTQSLVYFSKPSSCQSTFSMSGDTTVSEGSVLILKGRADCATGFLWSPISGPAPRILDPETKDLQVFIPRMAGDTALVYRLSVRYPDSAHYADVTVSVKADIPDPIFSMPSGLEWNGVDSVLVKPVITNLAAVQASAQPKVNLSWAIDGPSVDTAWREDGLLLIATEDEGDFTVNLCADNNGPSTCKSLIVHVSAPTDARRPHPASAPGPRPERFDAKGRRLPVSDPIQAGATRSLPVFLRSDPVPGN